MAAKCVYLSADVYLVCLNHALTTEKEEVMGLLIGRVDERCVSHVSAVIMLCRSDKRRDRVEISPEQLSDASTKAEELAMELGCQMRVLGWYHSHPHITVWPSHVDVQTQAMYQMMDEGFIGLIFSVFNEDKSSKHNRIQVTCFQSVNQSPEGEMPQYIGVEIPLHVVPSSGIRHACLRSLLDLPSVLRLEEQIAFDKTLHVDCGVDLLTKLHNAAVYTKSLCNVTEVTSVPLVSILESRLHTNTHKIKRLMAHKQQLAFQLSQARQGRRKKAGDEAAHAMELL